jgi:hypothetical protein
MHQASQHSRRKLFSITPLFFLLAGVAVACGSENATAPGVDGPNGPPERDDAMPSERDAGGGTGDGNVAALDSSVTADGQADSGPKKPDGPVVGAVSGFSLVVPSVAVYDIACNAMGCYLAFDGAGTVPSYAASRALFLQHGAATAVPLPAGPRLVSVTTVGSAVYGQEYRISGYNSFDTVFALTPGAAAWTQVGRERSAIVEPVFASLANDGAQLFIGTRHGIDQAAVAASASDPWTPTGTGLDDGSITSEQRVDSAGNLYARKSNGNGDVVKLAAGTGTWVKVPFGSAEQAGDHPWGSSTQKLANHDLTIAPNDDVWYTGSNFILRLPAGTSTWTRITLPAGVDVITNPLSETVADGNNDLYFMLGKPPVLHKVAAGTSTATSLGVSAATTDGCSALVIDGNGKLLLACWVKDSGTPTGLFRSTP